MDYTSRKSKPLAKLVAGPGGERSGSGGALGT
jgi:hypothetical protein